MVKPEEVKLSLEDILSRLFQYSNIADAAAHINSKMEYVVQIPLKYRQAFEELIGGRNEDFFAIDGNCWYSLCGSWRRHFLSAK